MGGGADVVIVGGGIIGCASAYELAGRGARVILLERGALAAGASGRNHGLLLSPLDPVLVPMARLSTHGYEQIQDRAPLPLRLDPSPIGFLIVAGNDERERATARTEAEAAAACGVASERLDAAGVHDLEPNVTPDVSEGWLLDDARRVDPAALTVSLGLLAREVGAEVRTGAAVHAVTRRAGRVTGVVTDEGTTEAETVVIAAGPWSGSLLRQAGAPLPVTGARGWLVSLDPHAPAVTHLVGRAGWHVPPSPELTPPTRAGELAEKASPAELGTLLQPNPDGTLLVGGSRQPVVTHEPEDPSVPRRLVFEAIRLAPVLADAPVLGSWWGIRPVTPDGRPLIGWIDDGLMVATGHGSLGVILADGTAQLIASLFPGFEPPFDAEPFDPLRFG